MESESKVLGKIDKKKCYLNHGKYGYYLNHDEKNYKIPEWFPVENLDIDIAERIIEYKKKMNELWSDDKKNKTKKIITSDSDEEEAPDKCKTKKK